MPSFDDTTAAVGVAYAYRISAVDRAGQESAFSTASAARPATAPPIIAVTGASAADEGSTYELLLGSVSYAGTAPVTKYVVSWGDGEIEEFTTAGPKHHVFADGAIIRDVRVDLFDGQNTWAAAGARQVNVADVAPTLTIAGAASVESGAAYNLALASEDPGDDAIIGWTIDWGDGTTSAAGALASSAAHTFTRAGTFIVRATAANEDGTFSSNAVTVTVTTIVPPPPPPAPGSTRETSIDLGLMRPRNKKVLRETLVGDRREWFYRITLDQPARLDAALGGLKGNSDLELLDAWGNILTRSAKLARKSERAVRVLPAGVYYVRVTLAEGVATSPFKLSVFAKSPSKRDLLALA